MQTPRFLPAGRMARVFSTFLICAALGLGCGKSDKGTAPEKMAKAKPPVPELQPIPKPKPKAPVELANLPANAQHLPNDATVLISVKAGALMKKGSYAELVQSPVFAQLAEEVDDEFLVGLLKDPAAAGLDVDQPIHFFSSFREPEDELSDAEFNCGLVASVKDPAKVKALLEMLIEAAEDIPLKLEEKEGYTALIPPAPAALGFSKDALVLVFNTNPERAPLMAGQLDDRMKGKNALAKDSRSAGLLQRPYDVAAWLDYSKVMDVFLGGLNELAGPDALPFGGLMPKMTKGMEMTAALRFEAGSMLLEMGSTYDAELFKGDFSKDGLDPKLAKYIPKDAILAGAEAFSMKPFREFIIKEMLPGLKTGEFAESIQQFENALGLSVEDLLHIPKGDVLLVFDGIKQADALEPPIPQFLLGLSIDNKKSLETLLTGPAMAMPVAVMKAYDIEIKHTDDGLFIYSSNHAGAIEAGQSLKPADVAHRALLAHNDIGGYIRFEPLVALLKSNPTTAIDPALNAIVPHLAKLDEAVITGKFGKGEQNITGKLTFKDKQSNGLKQLIDLIQALEESASFHGGSTDDGQATTRPTPAIEVDSAVSTKDK